MALDFAKLESLRLLCREIQQSQAESLNYFARDPGYAHVPSRRNLSISSSATCVLSLVATGKWSADKPKTKELLQELLKHNTSAKLPRNNPFTNAWILEAVTSLEGDYSDKLDPASQAQVQDKERRLQRALTNGKGAVSILKYPPSPYLTQLVVRVLQSRGSLTADLQELVKKWAWAELARQLALVQARSKTRDAYAVAYLLILVTAVTPTANVSPEQAGLQRASLEAVFGAQLEDGTWPLSRPLFPYPGFGDAYCYEYEMLTQLLKRSELRDVLLEYLPKLGLSAGSVKKSIYRVKGAIPAWTSGHHPNQEEPESWATASVYHFIHEFDRLLADAVRVELFSYLDTTLPPKREQKPSNFGEGFLDGTINVRGNAKSVKQFLWDEFVQPVYAAKDRVENGGKFRKGTPISAIFFGPPGTSKTELSQKIADYVGWPLLAIDPSHLLRNGMDEIQAQANHIFRRLEQTERVVVLFDEFDEFVRERGSSDAEQFSRLLTTAMLPKLANIHKRGTLAMLPKLANIHKRGTLIFIIATNNIQQFDIAIRRPGRFDRVVQILPPTYEEKMAKKTWGLTEDVDVEALVGKLQLNIDSALKEKLADLTFLEFDAFATDLVKAHDQQEAQRALDYHSDHCILRAKDDKGKTWKQRCLEEEGFNR